MIGLPDTTIMRPCKALPGLSYWKERQGRPHELQLCRSSDAGQGAPCSCSHPCQSIGHLQFCARAGLPDTATMWPCKAHSRLVIERTISARGSATQGLASWPMQPLPPLSVAAPLQSSSPVVLSFIKHSHHAAPQDSCQACRSWGKQQELHVYRSSDAGQ